MGTGIYLHWHLWPIFITSTSHRSFHQLASYHSSILLPNIGHQVWMTVVHTIPHFHQSSHSQWRHWCRQVPVCSQDRRHVVVITAIQPTISQRRSLLHTSWLPSIISTATPLHLICTPSSMYLMLLPLWPTSIFHGNVRINLEPNIVFFFPWFPCSISYIDATVSSFTFYLSVPSKRCWIPCFCFCSPCWSFAWS